MTATFLSDYYTNWVVKNEKATGALDYIFGAYDYVYLERKPDKFMEVHYDAVFGGRPEKEFDKYYTYYPEASGLPEYADMSFYVMVHESFNPSLTSRADNVYANRKPRKRHTFDTVRLFYEGIGIGLRKQEDVT